MADATHDVSQVDLSGCGEPVVVVRRMPAGVLGPILGARALDELDCCRRVRGDDSSS